MVYFQCQVYFLWIEIIMFLVKSQGSGTLFHRVPLLPFTAILKHHHSAQFHFQLQSGVFPVLFFLRQHPAGVPWSDSPDTRHPPSGNARALSTWARLPVSHSASSRSRPDSREGARSTSRARRRSARTRSCWSSSSRRPGRAEGNRAPRNHPRPEAPWE